MSELLRHTPHFMHSFIESYMYLETPLSPTPTHTAPLFDAPCSLSLKIQDGVCRSSMKLGNVEGEDIGVHVTVSQSTASSNCVRIGAAREWVSRRGKGCVWYRVSVIENGDRSVAIGESIPARVRLNGQVRETCDRDRTRWVEEDNNMPVSVPQCMSNKLGL